MTKLQDLYAQQGQSPWLDNLRRDYVRGGRLQELVDEGLVEKRRGLGMFVKEGARELLLKGERRKFLTEQWPQIAATIQRLGLTPKELMRAAANRRASKTGREGR